MPSASTALPKTLGELKKHADFGESCTGDRTVKQEIRQNLIRKMRDGERLFPGIVGFEDTVEPQIVNALLSRHHFILLGLRGQAKTRMIRGLTGFLDDQIPVVAGCESDASSRSGCGMYGRGPDITHSVVSNPSG